MPTTFTSHANVLCLTKNPMSFWADSNHRHRSCRIMAERTLPTELQNDVAAPCATTILKSMTTAKISYLAFNFSSQGFILFSIGGFIPPTTLTTYQFIGHAFTFRPYAVAAPCVSSA